MIQLSMSIDFQNEIKKFGWQFAISTQQDGNMSYAHSDNNAITDRNISTFQKRHNFDRKRQVLLIPSHLNGVIEVNQSTKQIFEKLTFDPVAKFHMVHADSIVTDLDEYAFSLKPADCALVLLT